LPLSGRDHGCVLLGALLQEEYAAVKLGAKGEALIKGFEELRLTSYPDSKGVWTIGWGHTGWYAPGVPVGPGQTCTPEQAEAWFLADTAWAVNGVIRCLDVSVTQNQFDSLVDFTFNEGVTALAHSTLIRDINEGVLDSAANEFLKWDYCGHEELEGLESRRRAERSLFLEAST